MLHHLYLAQDSLLVFQASVVVLKGQRKNCGFFIKFTTSKEICTHTRVVQRLANSLEGEPATFNCMA